MRRFLILLFPLISAPVAAQELGQRTTSPDAMVAQMSQASPEEEMRQAIAAADAHPLGTLENPVRVGGPEGEHAYLGRLRCADGATPRIGARSNAGVDAFGSLAAAYELSCSAAAPAHIVFDMYHEEHVETRAPAGFTLAR
jgi:hypothetical protein